MNRTLGSIIVIVTLLVMIVFVWDYNRDRTVDWAESFDEKSSNPYGLSVFYKELPNLFSGHKLKTVYHTPYNYFNANSKDGNGNHIAEGNYILVGNSDYLEVADVEELLTFASQGNTLLLSDTNFPSTLLDRFNLTINAVKNEDSISRLRFIDPLLETKTTTLDRSTGTSYFSTFEVDKAIALGYVNGNLNWVNFLEIPYKKGTIYLHLEPKVFTNYHLLTEERYLYTEGIVSYLPSATIYFDSYTKYSYPYDDAEKKSNLSWFLKQPSFKWAWYLAIILTFLFIIFHAKRRQRIIPVIKPLENTTVDFVKTISNLYYETQDHKNIIDKKITYFLQKIRSDYHLDTTRLNDEFIHKLIQKSGKNEETVKKTINFIVWLQTKNEFFEENLIKLNQHIEAFYSK